MLGGRKQASEMVFGHPKMRYAHMLKILFMVFLKYSPFSHCQLLLMCSDGEENSSDHLKDANQPNNISMGLWNFFFFFWKWQTLMFWEFIFNNMIKTNWKDSTQLDPGIHPVSLACPSAQSFPLSLGAGNRLFVHWINVKHPPEQSHPYWKPSAGWKYH